MVQPIDYTLNVADPFARATQGLGQGLELGNAYANAQRAKAKAERDLLIQQQMQEEISNVAKNPTPQNIIGLSVKYPQLSEQMKRAYDMQSAEDQKYTINTASQTSALMRSGQTEMVNEYLDTNIKALENSGRTNEASTLKAIKLQYANDPNSAQLMVDSMINAINPEKYAENAKTTAETNRINQLLPSDVAQGEANVAKTELENEWLPKTKQAEISNIESQIEDRTTGRVLQNKQIENQNKQFYANLDQSQKQFLMKLNQDERKLANELNPVKPENPEDRIARLSKVEDYDNAVTGAKNSAKMAEDMANNYSKLSDATGGYWNKLWRNIPGSDEKSFAQNLETLKSQIFLSQVNQMKGMGALTDQEGARLEKSIASLDPDLDPKELQKNLKSISSELNRAAQKAQRMAELYATRGTGYSDAVVQAAKKRGVTPYEMQRIANEMGY